MTHTSYIMMSSNKEISPSEHFTSLLLTQAIRLHEDSVLDTRKAIKDLQTDLDHKNNKIIQYEQEIKQLKEQIASLSNVIPSSPVVPSLSSSLSSHVHHEPQNSISNPMDPINPTDYHEERIFNQGYMIACLMLYYESTQDLRMYMNQVFSIYNKISNGSSLNYISTNLLPSQTISPYRLITYQQISDVFDLLIHLLTIQQLPSFIRLSSSITDDYHNLPVMLLRRYKKILLKDEAIVIKMVQEYGVYTPYHQLLHLHLGELFVQQGGSFNPDISNEMKQSFEKYYNLVRKEQHSTHIQHESQEGHQIDQQEEEDPDPEEVVIVKSYNTKSLQQQQQREEQDEIEGQQEEEEEEPQQQQPPAKKRRGRPPSRRSK
jgi:hypothetical protein